MNGVQRWNRKEIDVSGEKTGRKKADYPQRCNECGTPWDVYECPECGRGVCIGCDEMGEHHCDGPTNSFGDEED